MTVEFLLVVLLALGLSGFVKGATGVGLPLVAVPALAAFIGVPHALAIIVVPLIVTNIWQVWRYRTQREGTGFLIGLLPAGALGIALGTWALATLPLQALSSVLAWMVVAYVVLQLVRPNLRISGPALRRLAPAVGLVAGVLQGATGISAPVSITFVHAAGLARHAFVFAISSMFLLFSVVQFGALIVAGIMTWGRFLEGWIALVPITLTMPMGAWASRLLSRSAFDRLILGLLVAMALKLLLDSGQG